MNRQAKNNLWKTVRVVAIIVIVYVLAAVFIWFVKI